MAMVVAAMQFAALSNLPSVLSNPSHLLSLACSAVLMLQSLLGLQSPRLDSLLALSMATSMIAIAVRLVKALGSMLLMSYQGTGHIAAVSGLIDEIARLPGVVEVAEARFWQAHHRLCLATIHLLLDPRRPELGGLEAAQLRDRVTSLVLERLDNDHRGRPRLRGDKAASATQWEVSVATATAFS